MQVKARLINRDRFDPDSVLRHNTTGTSDLPNTVAHMGGGQALIRQESVLVVVGGRSSIRDAFAQCSSIRRSEGPSTTI